MNSIKSIIKSGLCLGCGICLANENISNLKYCNRKGYYIPDLKTNVSLAENDFDYSVCPGKGYEIVAKAKELYGGVKYDVELGYYRDFYAAYSNESTIHKNASSGGIITQLLLYLIEYKIVDLVVVTQFVYNDSGVRTKTILTNIPSEIFNAQGSKYCPVNINEALLEIKKTQKKIAIVGTPCQIAGIRQLQNKSEFKNIVLTISNLCGGFKSYNNIRSLTKYHKFNIKDVNYFRFRGGGQPGSLKISDLKGRSIIAPYPRYTGFNGYSKHLRCHLCVDATGELADISLGDLWLEKYIKSDNPWSIVILRSAFAETIMNDVIEKGLISTDKITLEDIKLSQKSNLTSKKIRQKSRMKLYKLLGYKIPSFDGGYYYKNTSMKTEITVFLKHKLLLVLENLNLYRIVKKMF
jgi:coenzyme F420 hydrogenase subunit beta